MGAPKSDVVKQFIEDENCWPELEARIRETFGETWGLT